MYVQSGMAQYSTGYPFVCRTLHHTTQHAMESGQQAASGLRAQTPGIEDSSTRESTPGSQAQLPGRQHDAVIGRHWQGPQRHATDCQWDYLGASEIRRSEMAVTLQR